MRTLAGVFALFLVLAPTPAAAAIHWRPTNPPGPVVTLVAPTAVQPYNDYAMPETVFAARRVVVHYVTRGIDAPPLNDDDGNSVSDYVERVADAADTAVEYYDRHGFSPVAADAAGPDARPDIYISRFAPGTFGIAYPSVDTWDGAFAVVANSLDPSGTASLGSIDGTVAHEVFHLVQFSYFGREDDPAIPPWTLEGSAAAMENRVFPALDDIVTRLQLRPWLDAPARSITRQSYGAQLLWRYLDERYPRLLPTYLATLAVSRDQRRAAFVATFSRVTHESFQEAFLDFAASAAERYGAWIRPRAVLHRRRFVGVVAPFGIHYVRLPQSGSSHLSLITRRGAVVVTGASRRLRPLRVGRALCFTLSRRRSSALLVVSNGNATRPLRYVARAMPETGRC